MFLFLDRSFNESRKEKVRRIKTERERGFIQRVIIVTYSSGTHFSSMPITIISCLFFLVKYIGKSVLTVTAVM